MRRAVICFATFLAASAWGGVTFDGTSNATAVQSVAKVTAAPLTICAWLKPTATNTYKDFAIVKSTDGNELFYIRWNNAGKFEAGAGHGGAFGASVSAGSYTTVWTHGCGKYTSATSRTAYLNGTAATADTNNLTPSGLNQTQTGAASPVLMQGNFAEVGIWSRALAADEITMLQKFAPNCLPNGLVTYVPMIAKAGSSAPDLLTGSSLQFALGSGTSTATDHPPLVHCQ